MAVCVPTHHYPMLPCLPPLIPYWFANTQNAAPPIVVPVLNEIRAIELHPTCDYALIVTSSMNDYVLTQYKIEQVFTAVQNISIQNLGTYLPSCHFHFINESIFWFAQNVMVQVPQNSWNNTKTSVLFNDDILAAYVITDNQVLLVGIASKLYKFSLVPTMLLQEQNITEQLTLSAMCNSNYLYGYSANNYVEYLVSTLELVQEKEAKGQFKYALICDPVANELLSFDYRNVHVLNASLHEIRTEGVAIIDRFEGTIISRRQVSRDVAIFYADTNADTLIVFADTQLPCASGSILQQSNNMFSCKECKNGQDTNGIYNNFQCTDCNPNYYAPRAMLTCQQCAPGTATTRYGSSSCTPCDAGYFKQAEQVTCMACEKGYTSSRGASLCTACALGFYNDVPAGLCKPCDANSYANSTASVLCTYCSENTYNTNTTVGSCVQCGFGMQRYMMQPTCTVSPLLIAGIIVPLMMGIGLVCIIAFCLIRKRVNRHVDDTHEEASALIKE